MPPEKCSSQILRADPEQIEAEVIELCRTHMMALYRYAAGLTDNEAIARDATHDAFMIYYVVRMGGEQVVNPHVWLAYVLKYFIIDRCRRSGSPADFSADKIPAEPQQKAQTADRQIEVFQRALASLPARERECLQLRFEGYNHDEIAKIMHIGKGTIGDLLSRALGHFRKAGALAQLPQKIWMNSADNNTVIDRLRLAWAEAQYNKRIQHRIWTYVLVLGLLTAAAALAAVLIK